MSRAQRRPRARPAPQSLARGGNGVHSWMEAVCRVPVGTGRGAWPGSGRAPQRGLGGDPESQRDGAGLVGSAAQTALFLDISPSRACHCDSRPNKTGGQMVEGLGCSWPSFE